jgi:hypothetical protein
MLRLGIAVNKIRVTRDKLIEETKGFTTGRTLRSERQKKLFFWWLHIALTNAQEYCDKGSSLKKPDQAGEKFNIEKET